MDKETIETYDQDAEKIAEAHASLIPEEIYRLIDEFFVLGGKTADIGCGIGRDSAWLAQRGFEVCGVDASPQMLNQARKRYPSIKLIHSLLPDLSALEDNSFDNILCSAVLMHLKCSALPLAAENLSRIMIDQGVIILSFRGTKQTDQRENGKLYEFIDPHELTSLFSTKNLELLHYDSSFEKGRNHLWHNMVFKKSHCLERPAATCQ